MVNSVIAKINRTNAEEFIWIVYFFLIGANLYATEVKKDNINKEDPKQSKKVSKIFLTTLSIAFLIYIYFVYVNYEDIKKYKKEMNKKEVYLSELSLIGAILFLVGGAIGIYVLYNHSLDEDIALI